ncbi:hypothetical protein GJU43_15035 [Flavobacterium sp. LC2016-23]|uniref:hypothetical protein n=1 Tax=Flavobacterium sp. LC2016-23 TaxID=2666330 RepID=UPI0012AFC28F|nr:hypothetical protein [Flavobacterium sp. LC2016-23]MRX40600.1 hypothetical protein [Flavobacterium sp. LC2016-23]
MAIKKYTVEVTRVDEYQIEIDDAIYTDDVIEQWSESFYETEEDTRQEDFVKHLAKAMTSGGIKEGLEGFGYVKQKHDNMEAGNLLTQYTSQSKKVTEEEYSPGLFVNIINHDNDYDTEIFTNEK